MLFVCVGVFLRKAFEISKGWGGFFILTTL